MESKKADQSKRWSIGSNFGILNIYKEKGFTSHDVVAILRKKLNTKKIGHTGTLDPDAEGVLPICIGKATKAVEYMIDKTKVYQATLQLGITTDTQDSSGTILNQSDVDINEEQICKVINGFIGQYDQIPPMYSAIRINGKRLYELARKGKTVEREPRAVIIYKIDHIKINETKVSMEVNCSKGTYIRTLCHDIGEQLGCGACMTELTRIKSGKFELDTALKLSEIDPLIEQGSLIERLESVEIIFEEYDKVKVNPEYNKVLYNGNKLYLEHLIDQSMIILDKKYTVYNENNDFIGLYMCIEKEGHLCLKPIKLFI